MLRVLLALIFLVSSLFLQAQRFGGNPPSVKWLQIDTDTARIIFPEGLDSLANRVSSIIHSLAASDPLSLGKRVDKIDIVLQNQTTIANGYVGLGPFRSEFFLTPALNNFEEGSLPWNDLLSVHEYRHVQQFSNFRNGISRVMRVVFGEEGYALAINASVPDWFYEGDAVHHETVLSRQGRGRLPLFTNAWPSVWNRDYSWMKIRNGSLKDYVPSHYHLGYLLVNYGYQKYGGNFWGNVTRDASAFKGLFYPFQKAIKKHAGISYKEFREQAFTSYREKSDTTDIGEERFILPLDKRRVTNYSFAQRVSSDSLVYLKSAFNRLPAFYIRDASRERKLRLRDISIDDQFSYRNGRIVYAAYGSHPRWTWKDYSEIRLLNVATNKQRTITKRSRYFTPDISESGERIAAVHIEGNGKGELHILNSSNGEITARFRSSDILLFSGPKFIDENRIVSAVRLTDGKTALAISDLRHGGTERLTPPSFNVVGFPAIDDEDPSRIYFTASYGGNDDLFSIRIGSREIYRLTRGGMGKYYVNASSGKITWSSFTGDGFQLQEMSKADMKPIAITDKELTATIERFPVAMSDSVSEGSMLFSIENNEYDVKKYSKATRLFNLHSWRPYYEDPEFSFSIYGQNILNTAETQVYYLYNENENTHAVGTNFIYGGWFPHLTAGLQYNFNRSRIISNQIKEWGQLDASLGVNVPLNWVSGKWSRSVNVGTNYVYRKEFNQGPTKNLFPSISYSYLHHFAGVGQRLQMARQHIFPRLGFDANANFRHSISQYESWQFIASAAIYLPGLMPNHHLVLTGAFQETDTLNVLFSNRMPYARGYNEAYFARMWRGSANYHFPIVYPDWGFANIFYLQRVRGNAFFDYMRVYSRDKMASANQKTVGGEIYFDTKWWNQYPLTFGVRYSYLLDPDFFGAGKNQFEIVLPVTIFPR